MALTWILFFLSLALHGNPTNCWLVHGSNWSYYFNCFFKRDHWSKWKYRVNRSTCLESNYCKSFSNGSWIISSRNSFSCKWGLHKNRSASWRTRSINNRWIGCIQFALYQCCLYPCCGWPVYKRWWRSLVWLETRGLI